MSALDFSLRAQDAVPTLTIGGVANQGRVALVTDEDQVDAERQRMIRSGFEDNQRAMQSGYAGNVSVVYDKSFTFGDDTRTRPVELRASPEAVLRMVDSGEVPASALADTGLSRAGLVNLDTADRFSTLAPRAEPHGPRITIGGNTYRGDVDTAIYSQRNADEQTQRGISDSVRANQSADREGSGQYQLTYDKQFSFGENRIRLPVNFQGPPEALLGLRDSGEITEQDLINNGLSSQGLERRRDAQDDWDEFGEQHPDAADEISRILHGEGLDAAETGRTAQRILEEAEKKGIPPVEAARRWADGRLELPPPPPGPPGGNRPTTTSAPGDQPPVDVDAVIDRALETNPALADLLTGDRAAELASLLRSRPEALADLEAIARDPRVGPALTDASNVDVTKVYYQFDEPIGLELGGRGRAPAPTNWVRIDTSPGADGTLQGAHIIPVTPDPAIRSQYDRR